ncbi:uncharacterized protein LOC132613108 [Lycium barbarum]|uniref:uncharacterized protein LOC132613108 n=1 Tax=Lycium barbarum TaxID=112863 RepID=UPI00293E90F3|nr:uncharacterized protein LOC132613108 [Lycium barbarum]
MKWLDNQDAVDCVCCFAPKNETMQHVFVEGKAAEYIWKAMGASLGIQHHHIPIRGLLNYWWNRKAKNKVHKLILQATPIMVCWEIWKAWTAYKYGDNNKFQLYRMVTKCIWNMKAVIQDAFPSVVIDESWISICNYVKRLSPIIRSVTIKWNKPQTNMTKLNTDGSHFKSTSKAGIEGVVRNEHGDLIATFSFLVQCNSSNQVKVLAIRTGVEWCIQNGVLNLHVELDSMVIANMLINKDTDNLKLKHIVRSTTNLLNGTKHCISHCFREVNKCADFLAKLAATSGNRTFYHSLRELPREVKGLLQLDKGQVPTFRRSYEKSNFFVS